MRAHVKELHISIGLPGSGKTTLFKKFYSEHNRRTSCHHIECDMYLQGNRYKDLESLLRDRSSLFKNITYLDGLFLKKGDIAKVLDISKEKLVAVERVIVHYWNPNREYCQWNDIGRRGLDSSITISNAEIDTIDDIMSIKEDFKDIKFEKKVYDVVKKEGWKVFADSNKLYTNDDGMLSGESWCLGGSWGDCWGNSGSVHPSSAPEGFRELDDLLEKVAPNISFLQYKKILSECVSNEEFSEGDYYGGSTYHNKQVLNVVALYNYLLEKEIIEEFII